MRVTVLCGSADPKGVTRAMCDCSKDCLSSLGYDVDLFLLGEMDIGHCKDCGACSDGECIINDDFNRIFDSVSESDILILASPIHFSSPSSLLKVAMDRFQPMWYGKSGHVSKCLGMLCGGSDRPNFELSERIFKAFSITCGMEYAGSLKISGTDNSKPDVTGDVRRFLLDHIG